MAASRSTEAASILVVDDEEVIREALSLVLSGAGYADVRAADSGSRAMRLAEERAPDLCILDLRMPGMDGVQTMTALKEANPRTRFIIVTACAEEQDEGVQQAVDLGASAIVYKPFQIREVTDAVETALRREGGNGTDCLDGELADAVLGVIPCGVVVLDERMNVLWANRPVSDWLSSDEQELTGRALEEVFPQDVLRATDLLALVSQVSEEGGAARLCSFWKGGALDAFAEELGGGRVVLGLDSLPEAEGSSARYANGHLAALSQFVGGLAHEVNNPLAGAAAYAQMLASRADAEGFSDDARRAVHIVEDQTARAARVIEELLMFAAQVGRGTEDVDLSAVARAAVTEAIEEAREQGRGGGIEVQADWADDLPAVKGDSERIKRACIHLVRNALEACGESGLVSVVTAARGSGDAVTFAVTDDGEGIEPGTLGKLFDPFFTTKDGSRGLGLSVVYGVAAESGGSVRARSWPSGSAFTLVLPTSIERMNRHAE